MKHNYVVLPQTTALSPGALETSVQCEEREQGEKRELMWAWLISQGSDKDTYLEVVKLTKQDKMNK